MTPGCSECRRDALLWEALDKPAGPGRADTTGRCWWCAWKATAANGGFSVAEISRTRTLRTLAKASAEDDLQWARWSGLSGRLAPEEIALLEELRAPGTRWQR